MGTIIAALMSITMHMGPDILGAGWSIYQQGGVHVDYASRLHHRRHHVAHVHHPRS